MFHKQVTLQQLVYVEAWLKPCVSEVCVFVCVL